MGFGIKIGNPIKSVTNAVTSAVQTVTNTVERSDIGNVVKVAVQPISTANEMRKDIFQGKFESAGNRALGTAASFNPIDIAIRSSSTVKGAFARDNFFGSYAQSSDAFTKLKSGQSLTADESKIVGLTMGKSAAIAGAFYAAPAAAGWIAANPGTATLVGSQLIKGSQTGNYNGAINTVGNSIAPGFGDVATGLLTPRRPTTGAGTTSGFTDFSSVAPQGQESASKMLFFAVGGVLLIMVLAIFKKMRS